MGVCWQSILQQSVSTLQRSPSFRHKKGPQKPSVLHMSEQHSEGASQMLSTPSGRQEGPLSGGPASEPASGEASRGPASCFGSEPPWPPPPACPVGSDRD